MIRRQKEQILANVGIIVLCVVVFVGMLVLMQTTIDSQCKQFGEGWKGKIDTYGPDFCVNEKGEAKFPR